MASNPCGPSRGTHIPATTLPLEVHVFDYEDTLYAFDVRNYAIVRLPPDGAAVLREMSRLSLNAIQEQFHPEVPAEVVRAWYLRILEMIRDGVFSVSPLPRPTRPPFQRLVVMLAGGCNMGCTYCFERDVPIYQDPNLMSRERADQVLDWFIASHEGSKAHVQFYGGEPLLNFQVLQHMLERLETWAESAEIELSKYLITNGTLLNQERIDYLKRHAVSIQVSVDGDAETHDRLRVMKSGAPSMQRIYPNIQRLRETGADFNLRAVLTAKNNHPQAVTQGLRDLGADRVSFEVVASGDQSIDLSPQEWDQFNQLYGQWLNEPFRTWGELPHEVQGTITRICEKKRVFYGCGAGVSEVTVAPDGSIYECQRIYREPYSNVVEGKSPRELDSDFLTMVDDRPVCQDCWARYLCGGGCLHQAQTGHGSDLPLPAYCTMKRSLVEAAIVKIAELRSHAGKIPQTSSRGGK